MSGGCCGKGSFNTNLGHIQEAFIEIKAIVMLPEQQKSNTMYCSKLKNKNKLYPSMKLPTIPNMAVLFDHSKNLHFYSAL